MGQLCFFFSVAPRQERWAAFCCRVPRVHLNELVLEKSAASLERWKKALEMRAMGIFLSLSAASQQEFVWPSDAAAMTEWHQLQPSLPTFKEDFVLVCFYGAAFFFGYLAVWVVSHRHKASLPKLRTAPKHPNIHFNFVLSRYFLFWQKIFVHAINIIDLLKMWFYC